MKIRLGYAAISTTLELTTSGTVTYTNYQSLTPSQKEKKLSDTTLQNIENLKKILMYNVRNEIHFYRMTSKLFPLFTHHEVNYPFLEYHKKSLQEIGSMIKKYNMRVDLHMDPFCVLNSAREEVVLDSIEALKHYIKMFEVMELDSRLILHIGAKGNSKNLGLKRFIKTVSSLDDSIKSRLMFENDDKVYNIRNTLKVCKALDVPMVLDYHHHLCNRNNEKIEDYIEEIFNTWKTDIPKLHFSSPKSKKEFRSHHDYIDSDAFITFLEKIKFINRDIDIMIEAKQKDEAMFRLIRELKYKTAYQFVDATSFLI